MNILNGGLPLPLHIVRLILSKLSIFKLPACRSVCKSWNQLVLDYAISCPKLHDPNVAIIITNYDWRQNPKIHCFDIHTLSFVASNALTGTNVFHWDIFSCCNGLLIIGQNIYNPMTHEYFPIPSTPPSDFEYPTAEGFGFSPKTQEYKLFRVVINKSTCELMVLRFGSKDNQWSSIYLGSPIYIHSDGVYMNGTIYWIGKQNSNQFVVYALDVETESFEVIGVWRVRPCQIFRLQPFNGTIYVIISTIRSRSIMMPRSQIQLWRMQDKNSWIRDFIVPCTFDTYKEAGAVHLLKASEDGEILVQIKRKLFWLKPGRKIGNKEKIKTLFPRNIRNYCVCPMESLQLGSPLHFGSLPRILAGDD